MAYLAGGSRGTRRARRSAVVGILAAVSTASGLIGQGTLPASAASGPPHGGTVTMDLLGVPATLDPASEGISQYTYSPAMGAIYGPGVAYITPAGKVVMGFAKSMTPSKNFKTWTITLHPGLKFSDGTPFNAASIAYNITRDADPTLGSQFQAEAATLKTKVVNATTLKISLQSPDSQFNSDFAADFGAVGSPTAEKSEGANFATKPVGPGPFVLQKTVLNTSQSFTPNKYFSIYKKGQPYLSGITLQSLPSYTQQVSALQTGSAQLAWSSNGQVFEQFKKAGVHVQEFPLEGVFFLSFQNQAAPFNNVLAREAIYYALDRTGVSASWAPGIPVSSTLFPKSSPLYSSKVTWPAKNSAKAQQLLNKLAAQGHPLDFTFMLPQGYPTLGPYVQSALSAYQNLKVTVKTELTPQYSTDLHGGTYQMTAYGLAAPSAVPFLTGMFQSTGPTNYEKWKDPKVDAAIAAYLKTSNPAKQKADWQIVTSEVTKTFPFVPTQGGVTSFDWDSNKVGGVVPIWYGETPIWNEMYMKSA